MGPTGGPRPATSATQGIRCQLYEAAEVGAGLALDRGSFDLVIDAAYGTGFRADRPGSRWDPPAVGDIPVLAVDIPSGVDGLTGAVTGQPLQRSAHRDVRRPQAGPAPGAGPLPGR